VIEVKLDLNVLRSDGLITSELKLLNKVLVRDLSETTTLICIKINVVDVKRSGLERGDAEKSSRIKRDTTVSELIGSHVALILLAELKDNLDLVVLHL